MRTDAHRPGIIVPADYSYRAGYVLPSDGMPGFGLEHARAVTAGRTVFGHTGKCGVCGAAFLEGEVWEHIPTGEMLHVGHMCADGYDLISNDYAFEELCEIQRQGRAATRLQARNVALRDGIMNDNPGLREALEFKHHITADIKARFLKFNTISPAQIALVLKLATPRPETPEEKHVPAPAGRVTFTGEIVSLKWSDNDFGGAVKITVKVSTPEGSWLAWGSLPRASEAKKGDKITLTATLEACADKPHFAFFKRPRVA